MQKERKATRCINRQESTAKDAWSSNYREMIESIKNADLMSKDRGSIGRLSLHLHKTTHVERNTKLSLHFSSLEAV